MSGRLNCFGDVKLPDLFLDEGREFDEAQVIEYIGREEEDRRGNGMEQKSNVAIEEKRDRCLWVSISVRHVNLIQDGEGAKRDESVDSGEDLLEPEDKGEWLVALPENLCISHGEHEEGYRIVDEFEREPISLLWCGHGKDTSFNAVLGWEWFDVTDVSRASEHDVQVRLPDVL